MKRILYLCLLLIIPFFLQAEHGRNRLNGKWISPYFNKTIKVKVKRYEVKIRGLTSNGWTYFAPIRRNVFEDCSGNRIRINSIHDLVYINYHRGERIRFAKKGHNHHNHVCNSQCSIGNDYFGNFSHNSNYDDFYGYDNYGDDYNDDWNYGTWGNRDNRGNRNNRNRNKKEQGYFDDGLSGQYHVRELDEFITINRTRFGLKAKRGNGTWVEYTQNRNRKNEYVDKKGNKYLVRSENALTWKNRTGTTSLNLKK